MTRGIATWVARLLELVCINVSLLTAENPRSKEREMRRKRNSRRQKGKLRGRRGFIYVERVKYLMIRTDQVYVVKNYLTKKIT